MSMRQFSLKYGKAEQLLRVPEEQLICEIVGKEVAPLPDLDKAVREALARPIDAPPLRRLARPGEKVVITVSDITRVWQRMDLVLPVMLDELNAAGVPDENITILIVVGAHRQNSESEFINLCGESVCNRVRVLNHDAWDDANMIYLGKTSRGTEVLINRLVAEADRVILTGGIIYHYNAGFGGGRKSILPGCSSLKTIQQNHLLLLGPNVGDGSDPNCMSGMLKGNAAHEDMMEIAAFVKPDFILNIVPTACGGVAGVFAGNWVSAWLEGTKLAAELYGVEIPAKADIVVTTAGGYPKDINLYQTGKTMDNACYAVNKGGVVVLLSECPDINEPPGFTDWFKCGDKLDVEKALRADFSLPGMVALKEMECSDVATFIMVTRPENFEMVRKARMISASTLDDAMRIAQEKCQTPKPQFIIMPQGANTLPLLGGKAQIG
jgi:nickel-dependent lactate racemase